MASHIRLFEFGDLRWCPAFIRRSITEVLVLISKESNLFVNTAPVVKKYLGKSRHILVLGAGSGGGILDVMPKLPPDVEVRLTDISPDLEFASSDSRIVYERKPVDATGDLSAYPGLRIMYDGFHHLTPIQASDLLRSTVNSGENILIFEACDRSQAGLWSCLVSAFYVLALMPKSHKLCMGRLVFTYFIPVIPLVMLWDGLVSCLRVYSRKEIRQMTKGLKSYRWKIGKLRGSQGEPIRYIAGRPRR